MSHDNDHTYRLTRELDAPVRKVWAAWTTPEQYGEWANSVPGSVELDVRPGGSWKATMATPGGEYPLAGTYVEVTENRHLAIGMTVPGRPDPAVMTVDFEDRGEQTRIVVSQTLDTAEERDMAEQGSNILLDGLTTFLAASAT